MLWLPILCSFAVNVFAGCRLGSGNVTFRDTFSDERLDLTNWSVERMPASDFMFANNHLHITTGLGASPMGRFIGTFFGFTSGNLPLGGNVTFTYGNISWSAQIPLREGLALALTLKQSRNDATIPMAEIHLSVINISNLFPDQWQVTVFKGNRFGPEDIMSRVESDFVEPTNELQQSIVEGFTWTGAPRSELNPTHPSNFSLDIWRSGCYNNGKNCSVHYEIQLTTENFSLAERPPIETETYIIIDNVQNNWKRRPIEADWISKNSPNPGLSEYVLDIAVRDKSLNISGERANYRRSYHETVLLHTVNKYNFTYGNVTWVVRGGQDLGVRARLLLTNFSAFDLLRTISPRTLRNDTLVSVPSPHRLISFIPTGLFGFDNALDVDTDEQEHLGKVRTVDWDSVDNYMVCWTPESLMWFKNDEEWYREEDPVLIPHTPMVLAIMIDMYEKLKYDSKLRGCIGLSVDSVQVQACIPTDRIKPPRLFALFWLAIPGGAVLILIGIVGFYKRVKRRLHPAVPLHRRMYRPSYRVRNSERLFKLVDHDEALHAFLETIEVRKEHFQQSNVVLGKGQSGVIYKGVVQASRNFQRRTTVAVKPAAIPVAGNGEEYTDELVVLSQLGKHLNVVRLLGVVFEDVPFLLLEYCSYGSLRSYVRKHKNDYYYSHISDDGLLLPYDEDEEWRLQAEAVKTFSRLPELQRNKSQEENFDQLMMSTKDLVSFSYQVCRGMEYLVQCQIVHRDLAARNVLVAENKVVKICDFGMAAPAADKNISVHCSAKLPIKWMSPEAITAGTFSHQTDVWSFGVLVWEVFSFGDEPYMELDSRGNSNPAVRCLEWILNGNRLDKPNAVPLILYDMMLNCWSEAACDRPTFKDLVAYLDRVMANNFAEHYVTFKEKSEH